MINWWNSLTTTQQIFALIAIPSTVVIIIQTILLLIGLGDGGDADIDSDGVVDGVDGDGLALFSVRGIMTMLAVMGWSGMALLETALPEGVSILIAVVLGFLCLCLWPI